jgi:hypothetical protein
LDSSLAEEGSRPKSWGQSVRAWEEGCLAAVWKGGVRGGVATLVMFLLPFLRVWRVYG